MHGRINVFPKAVSGVFRSSLALPVSLRQLEIQFGGSTSKSLYERFCPGSERF